MNIITKKDQLLLLKISEYGVLLIDQIALLNNSGKRIVQRKISRLFKNGFLNLSPRNNSSNYGRPENIISISEKGVKLLQNENMIDDKIPIERFVHDKIYKIEHEILLNWFRVHLNYIPIKLPDLKTDFISSKTPFLPLKNNRLPIISESFTQENHEIDFIPDGVSYLKSELQNKSLLLFLEVDMGTESLNTSSLSSNNIASKIKNYRAYFQSQKYKRYETKWNTKFSGFRLLFLTNSAKRKKNLCDLVSSDKSNDFIWVTHQHEMFEKSLGGKIWSRGGNLFTSQESILGPTLAFEYSKK
ncbi:MAG: replication-relaxation family protein [Ignavibacteriales bacterium]|nr:replication-relaxation family protein [Ignavibacteriales bacterium]